MIEVEVHNSLRAFLRETKETYWPHHLTMGRLVARALRLGRSALIQVGVPTSVNMRYRLSYLAPALIWPGPVIVVATEAVQQRLLMVEIPQLLGWIKTDKQIVTGNSLPSADFQGLLLTSPEAWLTDRLTTQSEFGAGIPTILDGVDDLESWTRRQLTATISPSDWEELMQACPQKLEVIRDARVQLTRAVFQHPANPYECYLLEAPEQDVLRRLSETLGAGESEICDRQETEQGSRGAEEPGSWGAGRGTRERDLDAVAASRRVGEGEFPSHQSPVPSPQSPLTAWKVFWRQFQATGQMTWAEIARQQGTFTLRCTPVEVAKALSSIWSQQPVVLIGGALELEAEAPIFRQRLGLGDLTCLKFSLDRQQELIQLYVPDRIPMPNTPQFQTSLLQEIRRLLAISTAVEGLTVLLVSDVPLKAQVGAAIAAEFGSRVQVEKTCLDDNGILVTGWEFWLKHQDVLPAPNLLLVATLPIPSLENPLVAGRVAYYKQQRQDWFRLYLLPEALNVLQRAIAPVRSTQGVIALLDSRSVHRSYGQQVLSALSPFARINYLDPSLFSRDR